MSAASLAERVKPLGFNSVSWATLSSASYRPNLETRFGGARKATIDVRGGSTVDEGSSSVWNRAKSRVFEVPQGATCQSKQSNALIWRVIGFRVVVVTHGALHRTRKRRYRTYRSWHPRIAVPNPVAQAARTARGLRGSCQRHDGGGYCRKL